MPNHTALAIAIWLREVARSHREAAQAKIAVLTTGQRVELGEQELSPHTLQAFAQSNISQASMLEALAYQVEQRTWPTEGPDIYVHHLHHGQTACRRPDIPGDWPLGHKWSNNWNEVTCPRCIATLRDRESVQEP